MSSSSVVFPQRPGTGVDVSAISSSTDFLPSSRPPPATDDVGGVAGNQLSGDLGVVVLRPTVRPPTYHEVATSYTPSRFTSVARQQSQQQQQHHPSQARADATSLNNTPRVSNTLPSPVRTPGVHHQLSLFTIPSGTTPAPAVKTPGNNNNNSSSSGLRPCVCPPGQAQPIEIHLSSSARSQRPAAQLNQTSMITDSQQHQLLSANESSSSVERKRRKLSCWSVGPKQRGEDVIPSLKYRTIGDTVKGCISSDLQRPLTHEELKVDWKRICALQSGQELHRLRPPIVDRDEYADPLKDVAQVGNTGKPPVRIPSGYVTIARGDGKWDHVPWGQRPTALDNVVICAKPTEIDPYEEKAPLSGSPTRSRLQGTPGSYCSAYNSGSGGGNSNSSSSGPLSERAIKNRDVALKVTQRDAAAASAAATAAATTASARPSLVGVFDVASSSSASRAVREAAAVPLHRPPSNPLIEEADRRLQVHGFGGLTTVSRASDEAVSHLLKFCGFSDAERLAVLWEVRKAQRNRIPL